MLFSSSHKTLGVMVRRKFLSFLGAHNFVDLRDFFNVECDSLKIRLIISCFRYALESIASATDSTPVLVIALSTTSSSGSGVE